MANLDEQGKNADDINFIMWHIEVIAKEVSYYLSTALSST